MKNRVLTLVLFALLLPSGDGKGMEMEQAVLFQQDRSIVELHDKFFELLKSSTAKQSLILSYLDNGADPNRADSDGLPPLHRAVATKRYDLVLLLLDRGAQINQIAGDGLTPLHRAVLKGPLKTIRLLLARGANTEVADSQGKTPLRYCLPPSAHVSHPARSSTQQLNLHLNPNFHRHVYQPRPLGSIGQFSGSNSATVYDIGVTPDERRKQLRYDIIVTLLAYGASPQGLDFSTVLEPSECAVLQNNYQEIDRLLYERPVNYMGNVTCFSIPVLPAISKDRVESALLISLGQGFQQSALLFLNHVQGRGGISIRTLIFLEHALDVLINKSATAPVLNSFYKDIRYKLLLHSEFYWKKWIKIIQLCCVNNLPNGVYFKIMEQLGRLDFNEPLPSSALTVALCPLACHKEFLNDFVMALNQQGVDCNAQDSRGMTPLHNAVLHGNTGAIAALLARHARRDIKDLKSRIPFDIACQVGSYSLEELTQLSPSQEHLLRWAVDEERMALVKKILDQVVVDVNSRCDHSFCYFHGDDPCDLPTPLELAVRNGDIEMARLLVKYGADVTVSDFRGETLLHKLAYSVSCPELVQQFFALLTGCGATLAVCDERRQSPLERASQVGNLAFISVAAPSHPLAVPLNLLGHEGFGVLAPPFGGGSGSR